MPEPRNSIHLTAELAAPREQVFDYLTDHFDEIWQGKMERVREGADPASPLGLGFVRRMHTPVGVLDEEIVRHDRPSVIEYRVLDDGEVPIHNHLGRIELSEAGSGGTRIDYTVGFDYRPPWRGGVTAAAMRAGWALRGRRRLTKRFGRP